MEYQPHDKVKMKKQHPCGSKIWTVLSTGCDIKLKCEGCGRIIIIDYVQFQKQVVGRVND